VLHDTIDERVKGLLSEALIALGHTHKPAVWQAACAQFGPRFGGKFCGAEQDGGASQGLEADGVADTPRRAAPSSRQPREHHVVRVVQRMQKRVWRTAAVALLAVQRHSSARKDGSEGFR